MDPNFHNGEFLLTDKLSYRFNEPQRGDVVVFKAPPNDENEFIKRIIALPGETVRVQGGRIYVNGNLLTEPYLDASLETRAGSIIREGEEAVVPAGSYAVFGDNRNHSFDSRNFGFIDKSKFTGRAWLLYWPPGDAGIIKSPSYSF